MSDMFQEYVAVVRKMSDPELARWTAGWKPGSDAYVAGEYEIRRRHEQRTVTRAWIAIGISAGALIVSALALVLK